MAMKEHKKKCPRKQQQKILKPRVRQDHQQLQPPKQHLPSPQQPPPHELTFQLPDHVTMQTLAVVSIDQTDDLNGIIYFSDHSVFGNLDGKSSYNNVATAFTQQTAEPKAQKLPALPLGKKYLRKPRVCTHCGEGFMSDGDLNKHFVIHIGEKPFSCHVCGEKFSTDSKLKEHEKKTDKVLNCNECDKTFCRTSQLEKHLLTHNRHWCDGCGVNFDDDEQLKDHFRTQHKGEEVYKCTHCEDKFSEETDLLVHLRSHPVQYVCVHCGARFRYKSRLDRHTVTHKDNPLPFPCRGCSKSFPDKFSLMRHVMTHTGPKPFFCPQCGDMFTLKSTLKQHILLHSGVKPYKCTVCEKSFSRKTHLNDHIRTHNGPFICVECDERFSSRMNWVRHSRVHSVDKSLSEQKVKQNMCSEEPRESSLCDTREPEAV